MLETCLFYLQQLLVCFPTSAFVSLICVHLGSTSSAVEKTICVNPARIKKYKQIIKKNNKKQNKIVLLGKDKLNTIKFLISKASIDSYITRYQFVSMNNVLREY